MAQDTNAWPSLRVDDWTATRDTLHMWTQIVGKIRLAHSPMVNHWWQVTLYVTPPVLTTSAIPHETEAFDIEFDFIDHKLLINSSRGARPVPWHWNPNGSPSSTPKLCKR